MQDYVRTLAETLGVTLDQERAAALAALQDPNLINKELFGMMQAVAAPDPHTLGNIMSFFKRDQTPKARGLQESIDNAISVSVSFARDAERHLKNAAEYRRELHEYLGKEVHLDLAQEIAACTRSRFFTFLGDESEDETAQNKQPTLVFATRTVQCGFRNESAGVFVLVNMGRYKVTWKPLENSLTVSELADNVKVGNHIHPHVSSYGGVCWGNAADVYATAMGEMKLHQALAHLEVILEQYNDGSPYRDLLEFELRRDPDAIKKYTLAYSDEDEKAWIMESDRPVGVEVLSARYDDDDNDEVLVALYKRVIEGTDIRVGNSYYVLSKGNYVEFDEGLVREWN